LTQTAQIGSPKSLADGAGHTFLEDIATARNLPVRDVMVRHVTTVLDATPIGVLGSLMRRHKLKHVPVLHEGRLVGIISRGDLLDALMTHRGKASG
jgi:CBS domain-containing protein